MEGMSPLLVRDGVRRDGFLATLGSRTWRSRAHSAAALADVAAVGSAAAYAGWLRRAAAAWSRLPRPPAEGDAWPLVAVGPRCLAGREDLAADLADLGAPSDLDAPTAPAAGRADVVDEAFLVGAAYVAVVAAGDAAVLAGAAHDAVLPGTRFLRGCQDLTASRAAVRRELAAWAADREPETAERAVLAARTLSLELAEALRS